MAMLPFSRCQVQAKAEPSLANDRSIDRSTPSSVTRNNGRLRVRKVNHLPSRPPTGRRACAPRSENKRINFSFVSWRSISRWKIICNNPPFEMNRRKCFQIIKTLSTPRAEEEVEKKIFAPCIGNQPCAYPKDWRCAQDYLQINHEYKTRKEKMILETFHSKLPNWMNQTYVSIYLLKIHAYRAWLRLESGYLVFRATGFKRSRYTDTGSATILFSEEKRKGKTKCPFEFLVTRVCSFDESERQRDKGKATFEAAVGHKIRTISPIPRTTRSCFAVRYSTRRDGHPD